MFETWHVLPSVRMGGGWRVGGWRVYGPALLPEAFEGLEAALVEADRRNADAVREFLDAMRPEARAELLEGLRRGVLPARVSS